MRIQLFAAATAFGWVDAKVMDRSMGVIGGILQPSVDYFTDFQPFFRAHLQQPRWEQLTALQLQGVTSTNMKLDCAGGIYIIDVEGYFEIEVELCGIDFSVVESLFSN